MTRDSYKIRYKVEKWDKPQESTSDRIRPGLSVSGDDYGYTDILFWGSILLTDDGESVSSVMIGDSIGGTNPTREVLELVKRAIEHHLSIHPN